MVAISLVMPCYNRSYDLVRTLDAYDQQTVHADFELIAIDDASTDSTWTLLSSYVPKNYNLQVLRQTQNQGPASARNRGIEVARAPIIAFVGDDIVPTRNFVEQHLVAHQSERDEKIAILGRVVWPADLPQNSLMTHIDGVGAQQFSYYYLKDQQKYDYRHFYTANISLKRSMLNFVDHWFDRDFQYAAYEDAELSYRLTKQGMQIRYVKEIEGYHYHYHTIWSFARRQYHCGLMARILIEKHPLLIKDVLGSAHRRLIRMVGLRLLRPLVKADDTMQALETRALTLASYYEWHPHVIVDQLYSGILEYFYCKGIFVGFFKNPERLNAILQTHASLYLPVLLRQFVHTAKVKELPLPKNFA